MATCFENLIKYLELVVRQLEQLKRAPSNDRTHVCKAWGLLTVIEQLYMEVFDD